MHDERINALVIKMRALIIIVGDALIGVLLGWFPHWHSAASLARVDRLGLPWWIIGVVFIGCAALVAFPKARTFGYGGSAVLFFTGATSSADTQMHSKTANALLLVGIFMLAGVLVCGVATAQVDQGRRRDAP